MPDTPIGQEAGIPTEVRQAAQAERSFGHGFGTLPVFLAAISTILGAIMFLRFGYAVGHLGLMGALGVVALGHMVTIPTALAVSEIATNRRVEGGGAYYIISRSFGQVIGGAIGISLYLSQAISVAFYMIAFAESLTPLAPYFQDLTGIAFDTRMASIPGTLLLGALILKKGAGIGIKVLFVVVVALLMSLVSFFLGSPLHGADAGGINLTASIPNGDSFVIVFAIVFPAFTGMAAGVGLSGDLKDPGRSIPLGTLAATVIGLVVYVAVMVKLAACAPAEILARDEHVMSKIALFGPLVYVGLAAATLSSAIGSILVAPRTLQALGADRCFPSPKMNRAVAAGVGKANEPQTALLVTLALAMVFVAVGTVDFVARVVSMFFMVTYGALCAISFLEHFAANPSYRPVFRSKWYVSLFGAVISLLMMFQMDPFYAVLSIVAMAGLYRLVKHSQHAERDDMSAIFQGVMSQATRYLQLRLQKGRRFLSGASWRPSVIMVSARTFERKSPRDLLGWICHRQGFGTYLHFIRGELDRSRARERVKVRERLVALSQRQQSGLYTDALVSPSMLTALAQALQLPGVSGMDNNSVLFEFAAHDEPERAQDLVEYVRFARDAGKNALVLRHGDNNFGDRARIHLWITRNDDKNASLMVLLAYIIMGHQEWQDAEIRVYAALPRDEVEERRERLYDMISTGRIPVSQKNIRIMPVPSEEARDRVIDSLSSDADLVILGFDLSDLDQEGGTLPFLRHPKLRDVLFVSAKERIHIT